MASVYTTTALNLGNLISIRSTTPTFRTIVPALSPRCVLKMKIRAWRVRSIFISKFATADDADHA